MAQPRVYLRQKWTRYLGELRPIHDIYVDVVEPPLVTPTVTPTNTMTPTVTPTVTSTPSSTPYICFTGYGFNDRVDISELDVLNSNKLYVGGNFTDYNGVTRENITRIYTNGEIDYTFDSGTGFNVGGILYDIHQIGDGKIVVCGDFTEYRGVARKNICRINSDGTLDTSFVVGTGFQGVSPVVRTIGQQSNGKLIVGGVFTSYSGISCLNLCRLNTDGSFDPTFVGPVFSSTTIFSGTVETIVINSDDSIYIGCSNLGISGSGRQNIFLLTSGGSLDSSSSFNTSGVGTNLPVFDILKTQTNKLLVTGSFTNYNGSTNNRIIRLNSDGTKDTSFTNTIGPNNLVYDVVEQTNGKYLICGFFSVYSGITSNGLIRLNSNGYIDNTFSAGTFFPSSTESKVNICLDNSQSIYVGGEFTSYSGYDVRRFVKLYPSGQINDCDLVLVTPTPSCTPTLTPGLSPSVSPTNTVTPSLTPSVTVTNTLTPSTTSTPQLTQTNTPSITPTNTNTVTPSVSPSLTPTNTNTPSITPSITPSPTPPGCQTNFTIDNNTTGGGIDITDVTFDGFASTYVSGDSYPIGPGGLGTYKTPFSGTSLTVIISYDSSNSNHAINVVDCAGNSFCCDNLASGVGSCLFEGVYVDCTCSIGLQIIANNGDCL